MAGENARSIWIWRGFVVLIVGLTLWSVLDPGGGSGVDCHPSYEGVCIPMEYESAGTEGFGPDSQDTGALVDVECSEIDAKSFKVVGDDEYELDRDGDGLACEPDPTP